MSKIKNNIGWCDETGNKVTGCDKVSPGCKNCYAEVGTRARVLRGQAIETWGAKGQRYPVKDFTSKVRRLNKLCVSDRCRSPRPWNEMGATRPHFTDSIECDGELRRIRFFADSNSDWLDDKWPIETLADLLKDIHDCPNVDFQLLTKRPENWRKRIVEAYAWCDVPGNRPTIHNWLSAWLDTREAAPANIWLGVSVEDQKRSDERIPLLLQIPAKVRFLSVEPLLEAVDLKLETLRAKEAELYTNAEYLNWVIVGGESGKNRRDCGVEAICDVARQCVAAGVPVYVKQDVAFKSGEKGRIDDATWALKQFPK